MGRLNTKVIILLQLFECKKIINALNHPQTSLCSRTFILTRKNLLNLQTRKAVYLVTKYKLKSEESKRDQTRSHQTFSPLKISNCVITSKRRF